MKCKPDNSQTCNPGVSNILYVNLKKKKYNFKGGLDKVLGAGCLMPITHEMDAEGNKGLCLFCLIYLAVPF